MGVNQKYEKLYQICRRNANNFLNDARKYAFVDCRIRYISISLPGKFRDFLAIRNFGKVRERVRPSF